MSRLYSRQSAALEQEKLFIRVNGHSLDVTSKLEGTPIRLVDVITVTIGGDLIPGAGLLVLVRTSVGLEYVSIHRDHTIESGVTIQKGSDFRWGVGFNKPFLGWIEDGVFVVNSFKIENYAPVLPHRYEVRTPSKVKELHRHSGYWALENRDGSETIVTDTMIVQAMNDPNFFPSIQPI